MYATMRDGLQSIAAFLHGSVLMSTTGLDLVLFAWQQLKTPNTRTAHAAPMPPAPSAPPAVPMTVQVKPKVLEALNESVKFRADINKYLEYMKKVEGPATREELQRGLQYWQYRAVWMQELLLNAQVLCESLKQQASEYWRQQQDLYLIKRDEQERLKKQYDEQMEVYRSKQEDMQSKVQQYKELTEQYGTLLQDALAELSEIEAAVGLNTAAVAGAVVPAEGVKVPELVVVGAHSATASLAVAAEPAAAVSAAAPSRSSAPQQSAAPAPAPAAAKKKARPAAAAGAAVAPASDTAVKSDQSAAQQQARPQEQQQEQEQATSPAAASLAGLTVVVGLLAGMIALLPYLQSHQ